MIPSWRQREKSQREKPPLLQAKSKFAVMVINQEKNQFAKVAILPAKPFMFTGRICLPQQQQREFNKVFFAFRFLQHLVLSFNTSDIMSHGIGPIPNEKETTIACNDSTELKQI